jgi:hypothetical protein
MSKSTEAADTIISADEALLRANIESYCQRQVEAANRKSAVDKHYYQAWRMLALAAVPETICLALNMDETAAKAMATQISDAHTRLIAVAALDREHVIRSLRGCETALSLNDLAEESFGIALSQAKGFLLETENLSGLAAIKKELRVILKEILKLAYNQECIGIMNRLQSCGDSEIEHEASALVRPFKAYHCMMTEPKRNLENFKQQYGEVVQATLQSFAAPNTGDSWLHLAARQGLEGLTVWLLGLEARLDQQNDQRKLPFQVATIQAPETAKRLLPPDVTTNRDLVAGLMNRCVFALESGLLNLLAVYLVPLNKHYPSMTEWRFTDFDLPIAPITWFCNNPAEEITLKKYYQLLDKLYPEVNNFSKDWSGFGSWALYDLAVQHNNRGAMDYFLERLRELEAKKVYIFPHAPREASVFKQVLCSDASTAMTHDEYQTACFVMADRDLLPIYVSKPLQALQKAFPLAFQFHSGEMSCSYVQDIAAVVLRYFYLTAGQSGRDKGHRRAYAFLLDVIKAADKPAMLRIMVELLAGHQDTLQADSLRVLLISALWMTDKGARGELRLAADEFADPLNQSAPLVYATLIRMRCLARGEPHVLINIVITATLQYFNAHWLEPDKQKGYGRPLEFFEKLFKENDNASVMKELLSYLYMASSYEPGSFRHALVEAIYQDADFAKQIGLDIEQARETPKDRLNDLITAVDKYMKQQRYTTSATQRLLSMLTFGGSRGATTEERQQEKGRSKVL